MEYLDGPDDTGEMFDRPGKLSVTLTTQDECSNVFRDVTTHDECSNVFGDVTTHDECSNVFGDE